MARAHTTGVRLTPAQRYSVTKKLEEMKKSGQLPLKKTGAQAAAEIGKAVGLHLTKWHVQAAAETLGMKMSDVIAVDIVNGSRMPMSIVWSHITQLESRVTQLENIVTSTKGQQ